MSTTKSRKAMIMIVRRKKEVGDKRIKFRDNTNVLLWIAKNLMGIYNNIIFNYFIFCIEFIN